MQCTWTISFVSSIGDVAQLEVQAYNPTSTASPAAFGYTSTSSTDSIATATVVQGHKDAIKAALEALGTVGKVTVTPLARYGPAATGACSWRVTFDTKAGDLDLMRVALFEAEGNGTASVSTYGSSSSSSVNVSALSFGVTASNQGHRVTVSELIAGTSERIGGNFTVSYSGARSAYVPHNADSRTLKAALEDLDTIGQVDVARSVADENNGYTWTITFLTELGSLDYLEFDGADMTGTVVTGTVAKYVIGIAPPFNSLDTTAGLPLGSAIVAANSTASASASGLSSVITTLTVSGLTQGIPYYFRVAAMTNSTSASQDLVYMYPTIPYAVPALQKAGPPVNASLEPVDGTSLRVSVYPPETDGGAAVTFYKVN
jgi:hypothetical protein